MAVQVRGSALTVVSAAIVQWLFAHLANECFIGSKHPPQQHNKKGKEDYK
jgi:hypothetical protein